MATGSDLHKGHRQRMRERAIRDGLDSFDPHQVIELLLFYAIPVQDVSDLAHRLINRFGTVQGVLNAPAEELSEIKGVGKGVIEWFGSIGELIDSYASLRPKDRIRIRNYFDAGEFAQARKKKTAAPATYQVSLAPAGMVLMYTRICDSQAWGESEVLRGALRDVLAVQARNVIVIEYVGAESAEIFEEDEIAAKRYASLLNAINVSLMDVIKVSEAGRVSMRRTGLYDDTIFENSQSHLSEGYLREEDSDAPASSIPDSDDGL